LPNGSKICARRTPGMSSASTTSLPHARNRFN